MYIYRHTHIHNYIHTFIHTYILAYKYIYIYIQCSKYSGSHCNLLLKIVLVAAQNCLGCYSKLNLDRKFHAELLLISLI